MISTIASIIAAGMLSMAWLARRIGTTRTAFPSSVSISVRRLAAALLLGWGTVAGAFSISLEPASASVAQGDPIILRILVDGLRSDGQILSAYDIDIAFQPDIAYLGANYFGALGSDIVLDTPGIGTVNLFGSSLESDAALTGLQGDSFSFATLQFVGNSVGSFSFNLFANAMAGAIDPQSQFATDLLEFNPTLTGTSVTVLPRNHDIPEPASGLLLGVALLVLARRRH